MKFKRWYVFPLVFIAWFTTVAATGCGSGTSSTGADVSIVGDDNLVCIATGTAADDNKLIEVDCDMMGDPEEPEEPGES